ncbi:MAG: wax ester/triacylglycerol synthase family O-acyltransferase [Halioglobus sp.]|jgi:diacylglycerol O-acyltransferase / wax synthase
MRQITGGDAFFLYTDKQSRHQHISMLYIYDQSTVKGGPLRFKTILDNVEKRLGASPVFRQRLVQVPLSMDYPYWINDPDFDLEFHVRHIALPKPGDWRQLCIQVSRLHSRPLDLSRPVWEMYVIEGLDNVEFLPKGAFAIMTKVHHVAIDGVSAAELTMGIHDTEPYPEQEKRQVRWRPEPEPRPVELLVRAGFNNARRSFHTGATVARKLEQAFLSKKSPRDVEKSEQDEPAPITRFNHSISPNRVWDAARFQLDDFKAIKAVVPGATINDAVLTVCGGAMLRYLDSKQETPDRSLTAMVPVSVRSEKESGAAGNKVHLARASLKTMERDPLKRLALVYEEMQKLKRINAVSARDLVEMQEELPAPTLVLAGKAVVASMGPGKAYRARHNMVVTNVPGPQQPLYFCGAKLVMFTGLAVISDNMGISHAVTSYDGTLVIAPLSDRQIMPDPAFYRECLEEAFEELRLAAGSVSGQDVAKPASRKRVRKQSAARGRPRKKSTKSVKGKTQ